MSRPTTYATLYEALQEARRHVQETAKAAMQTERLGLKAKAEQRLNPALEIVRLLEAEQQRRDEIERRNAQPRLLP